MKKIKNLFCLASLLLITSSDAAYREEVRVYDTNPNTQIQGQGNYRYPQQSGSYQQSGSFTNYGPTTPPPPAYPAYTTPSITPSTYTLPPAYPAYAPAYPTPSYGYPTSGYDPFPGQRRQDEIYRSNQSRYR